MLCRVLLVDDDALVISALRRELLRKPDLGNEGVEIESFLSADAALARAAQPEGYFDVAIVDYRMRCMDGVRFFERLRQLQPDAVRILITGRIDLDGAIGAINSARIDQLVTKPWSEYDLKARVVFAMRQRSLLKQLREHQTKVTRDVLAGPYRMLMVDDDAAQLNALEREVSLRGLATRGPNALFEIIKTTLPEEALVIAGQCCPDIVISDYKMPVLDGVSFLARLRVECPYCVSILMSGYADIQVLVEAINRAGVYHFVGKPWEPDALRSTIAEALSYRDLLMAVG